MVISVISSESSEHPFEVLNRTSQRRLHLQCRGTELHFSKILAITVHFGTAISMIIFIRHPVNIFIPTCKLIRDLSDKTLSSLCLLLSTRCLLCHLILLRRIPNMIRSLAKKVVEPSAHII